MRQIVIADDEPTTRRLLRSFLHSAGYEVLEASDGEEAWALLQRSGATLLITDWLMPGLDGRALIQRIRTTEQTRYVYTILLTARDSKLDTISGLEGGADDYLTKPFYPDELRARLAIGVRILQLESNLREARDRFAYQASHDPLTGLLNRLAITQHVDAELSRADRADEPLSIALIDLDHFKQINDQHGHAVGDQALCHIAPVFVSALRPYDWLGRWGGEEFLVVLAKANRHDAAAIAERIRVSAAEHPLSIGSALLSFTVSVGVASTDGVPESLVSAAWLFRHADDALYAAKRGGRNRVVLADR